ncbi:hypothetical protein F2P79_025005 [Pimephales promelas]|nr:hypothetical protein F2P79_025005 [Pimephales promelas]
MASSSGWMKLLRRLKPCLVFILQCGVSRQLKELLSGFQNGSLMWCDVKLVKQPHPVARGDLPGHLLVPHRVTRLRLCLTADQKTGLQDYKIL